LEKALKARGGNSDRLVYYVFDILYLDGLDLRSAALIDRKRVLADVLAGVGGPVRFSEHTEGDGGKIWRRACELELEGLVSKRRDGRYRSGRSDNWVKVICRHRDTFAVVGWAEKRGRFDGLYLGRVEDGEIVYAGKLERGFSTEDQTAMVKLLKPLRIRKQPMTASRKAFPKARWVKPRVLVDAEFRGKTAEGLLRHSAFKGLREDLMD
jgi:bifunctional non-homologous end joining protein LigD